MRARSLALLSPLLAVAIAIACGDSESVKDPHDAATSPPIDSSTDALAAIDATPSDAIVAPDVTPTGCVAPVAGAPADEPFRRVRATTDLPDDAPGAYQVHLLYVEPSDRDATARLDEDGSIRRSAQAWNGWLAARTGGPKLRLDTCGGVLDVTHVKLGAAFTEAALAQGTSLTPKGTAYLRDRLEAELAKTFAAPNKLYLVVYDGLAFGHCGGAPFPPSLIGHFPALFVGGLFSSSFLTKAANAGDTSLSVYDPSAAGLPSGAYAAKLGGEAVSVTSVAGTTVSLASPLAAAHAAGEVLTADARPPDCRTNPFSADGIALGYADYSAPHELMHALGIVATTAPFHSATAAPGHLSEASAGGTADLMFQGTQAWACSGGIHASPQVSPCVLDPAHQNYFMVASASDGGTIVDLAKSVFLDPTPPSAVLPPGW